MKQTAWDSSGGVSRAERSAAAMLDQEVQSDSGIQISMTLMYTLIAIGIVLLLGVWTGGYKYGFVKGKQEMGQYVQDPIVSPVEPGSQNPVENASSSGPVQGSIAGANPASNPSTPPSTRSGAANPPAGGAASAKAGIMTPTGFSARDPRKAGMNYLVLATLDAEQAADAISFLYAGGVSVIGVPQLDSSRSGANNPPRYTLYSLGLAIPGNRWSAMSSERSQHQRQIANLGARWQREHRGGSDFSQTNWEKYEP